MRSRGGGDRHLRRVRIRILLLAILAGGIATAILTRLVHIQVIRGATLREEARRQQEGLIRLMPARGAIYDARGRELTVSIEVDSLYADPSRLEDPAGASRRLSKVLGIPPRTIRAKFRRGGKRFTWVARKLSPKTRLRIEKLSIPGLGFLPESKRFYPKRALAAHLLGYVGIDSQGLAGLEFRFDEEIRGRSGNRLAYLDARGGKIPMRIHEPPTGSRSLLLTIDEVIQHIVEKELGAAVRKTGARAGSAVLIDPNTGDLLALANRPTFNPNDFGSAPGEHLRNRAISDCFEPGSTFKVFTMAAALQGGRIREGERINCRGGSIRIAGRTIRDHRPFGILTPSEVLAHSSNVGAIEIGSRIPDREFHRFLRSMGFGTPTGVDLPGENPGILHPPAEWSRTSYASLAIGHEVCVTPLQLASALSAVVNGGRLRRPRLVRAVLDEEGEVLEGRGAHEGVRVLPPEISDRLREEMMGVVERGTGRAARIPGYTVGGKTGTAQKVEPDGTYSSTRFVASFFGFAPVHRPAVALLVVLDEPRRGHYGAEVAAPVFARIAPRVLRYLRVRPDRGDPSAGPLLARLGGRPGTTRGASR